MTPVLKLGSMDGTTMSYRSLKRNLAREEGTWGLLRCCGDLGSNVRTAEAGGLKLGGSLRWGR
jgi:hypothetical protein